MSKTTSSLPSDDNSSGNKFGDAILNFIGNIPETDEVECSSPHEKAESKASSAAGRAALAAGALALPPGPLGWATILPEVITVWKIQAQMVSDIAAIFGKRACLTREQMLFCLFRHVSAQVLRDLIVRVGERYLVRRVSLRVLQNVARQVGFKITQRAIGKGVSRWIPLAGAAAVAAYAYWDTSEVAKTAIDLFSRDIEFETEATSNSEDLKE